MTSASSPLGNGSDVLWVAILTGKEARMGRQESAVWCHAISAFWRGLDMAAISL
jgi:hypothetical protein